MNLDKFLAIQMTALKRYYDHLVPVSPEDVKALDDIVADLDTQTPYKNPKIHDALVEYLKHLEERIQHLENESNPINASQYKKAYQMTKEVVTTFNRDLETMHNINALSFVDLLYSKYHEIWDVNDIENVGYHVAMRTNQATSFDIFANGDVKVYNLSNSSAPNRIFMQFLSQAPSQWFLPTT